MNRSKDGQAPKRSPWAETFCLAVEVMTLYAFFINLVTFGNEDLRPIVIQAVVIAALAVILGLVIWRRVSFLTRVVLAVCFLANFVTLVDAGGRRLPAVMGW